MLGSITGRGAFDEVRRNAVEFDLFGRKVRVMSIDDLIKAKEARGRPKDILTAQELRAIAPGERKSVDD
jgi:hypothetical protein